MPKGAGIIAERSLAYLMTKKAMSAYKGKAGCFCRRQSCIFQWKVTPEAATNSTAITGLGKVRKFLLNTAVGKWISK